MAKPEALDVFFDGDCPLCCREIAFIKRFAKSKSFNFVDIAAVNFSAERYDKTQDEFMGQMHVRDADQHWHIGVDAFRAIYAALGFNRMVALSKIGWVDSLARLAYRWFANNRLRITGRCDAACKAHGNSTAT